MDTAKDGSLLDHKHVKDSNEDHANWLDIAKKLNIELPFIFLMIGIKTETLNTCLSTDHNKNL